MIIKNETLIKVAIAGVAIIAIILYMRSMNNSDNNGETTEEYEVIEEVEGTNELEDDAHFIDQAEDDTSFQLGLGVGPGLYGSGRHTSEMVGN